MTTQNQTYVLVWVILAVLVHQRPTTIDLRSENFADALDGSGKFVDKGRN
jgi:hypothetical protein